ncbi:hypothetical protein IAU60_006915 [Kwoniella sp. DSM 27419]
MGQGSVRVREDVLIELGWRKHGNLEEGVTYSTVTKYKAVRWYHVPDTKQWLPISRGETPPEGTTDLWLLEQELYGDKEEAVEVEAGRRAEVERSRVTGELTYDRMDAANFDDPGHQSQENDLSLAIEIYSPTSRALRSSSPSAIARSPPDVDSLTEWNDRPMSPRFTPRHPGRRSVVTPTHSHDDDTQSSYRSLPTPYSRPLRSAPSPLRNHRKQPKDATALSPVRISPLLVDNDPLRQLFTEFYMRASIDVLQTRQALSSEQVARSRAEQAVREKDREIEGMRAASEDLEKRLRELEPGARYWQTAARSAQARVVELESGQIGTLSGDFLH